jgi:hypothetical protein
VDLVVSTQSMVCLDDAGTSPQLARRAAGHWGNREAGENRRVDNPLLSVAPYSSRGRQHKTGHIDRSAGKARRGARQNDADLHRRRFPVGNVLSSILLAFRGDAVTVVTWKEQCTGCIAEKSGWRG